MTTTPDPRYVTHSDLEALEGRIINRISELEIRLLRDAHGFRNWVVALILPIYALMIAALIFLYNAKGVTG